METVFGHEKLEVYQHALRFVGEANELLEDIPKSAPIRDQLDRTSISIPLNIAEGNGKWTERDRCRFFDIAHGSAVECAAALDIAVAKNFLKSEKAAEEKQILGQIVRMLVGLIKASDPSRTFGQARSTREEGVDYSTAEERDED